MSVEWHDNVKQSYLDYCRDESRRVGQAARIAFPGDEHDVQSVLREAAAAGECVTIQGARTGITGGAVPEGGTILNLSKMNRILGCRDGRVLTVQPGVLLADVRSYVASEVMPAAGGRMSMFAPDPTETSASIGGMIACNASGARSFRYGSTRRHVDRLRLMLVDGSILECRRGETVARGRQITATTEDGRTVVCELPGYTMPAVKHAAGYYVADNMDLLDLFIGSEGTLGVVLEADLILSPAPVALWGLVAFFPSETDALSFVEAVRQGDRGVAAIEYFGTCALGLLREHKASNPACEAIPDLSGTWDTAVYVELDGDSESAVEEAMMAVSERMVTHHGSDDACWLATNDGEMARLKAFRHAVPEAVNWTIDQRRRDEPGLTKLGTDLAVPNEALRRMMALYREGLGRESLDHVVFGHIGDNHVHVNILPHTLEEYERGKRLYLDWARAVVDMGGSVSAEHGIGKLKKAMLRVMFGDEGVAGMRRVKRAFDPDERLNRGNLF